MANEDIGNGKVVQRKEIQPNKRPHRKKDGNKQKDQSTTLNWNAKIVVKQDPQLAIPVTKEKKSQHTQMYLNRNQKQGTENNKTKNNSVMTSKKPSKTVQITEVTVQFDNLTPSGSECEQSLR